MNLEPAPRLPKWTFLAIDAGLLVTAFLIAYFAKNPYAPLPFLAAVLLVVAAAIVGLVPFLIDYAADSAEYVQQERSRVSDQVQRLHTAAESLARAAAQIKAVEEAVHKTAHAAENLPYRMQEKLAEFNETIASREEEDREALEQELAELRAANSGQLKSVAEKIQQAAADWTALEAATRKQLTAAEAALAKVSGAAADTAAKFEAKLASALAALDRKLATLNQTSAAAPAPVAAPAEATGHEPPPAAPASAPLVESVSVVETTAPVTAVEEPRPKKIRAPRKPKPEETLAAMSDTPAADTGAAPAGEDASVQSDDAAGKAEPSASSDGATRLLATAYIGIGNKLFIRGAGPGLSWDKGVPMQFVSIGKWGWATHDATGPINCKLYKNDETAALSGEVILEPGKHVEVTALF
jgi:chemotaxis protein histidine kinase CheA